MGEVYQLRDTRQDRSVAVKALARYISDREDMRAPDERFARVNTGGTSKRV